MKGQVFYIVDVLAVNEAKGESIPYRIGCLPKRRTWLT